MNFLPPFVVEEAMESVVSVKQSAVTLSESQKVALLKLLTDEDPEVHHTIRKRILSQGYAAAGWLRQHRLSSDPVLRRRVNAILLYMERQEADTSFLGFCISRGEDFDLEQGCWLLAQTQYPNINPAGYSAMLDEFAANLLQRLDAGAKPQTILEVINRYLFTEVGFRGNAERYYEAENSYLNCVIDRRTGIPITLCLVYLFVCRRLRLPVAAIGMPGHFLCRFQNSKEEIYIDAFHRGQLLTRNDCIRHLTRTGHEYTDRLMAPVSPRRTLLRICTNLHQIYVNQESPEDTARFQRYIVALGK